MKSVGKRNLWIYALTRAVSSFGNQFQFFALTSLTYSITGSPLITAIQMAASGLPYILFANWAGPVADRYDPRKVTAVALVLQALLTLGYIFSTQVAVFVLLNILVSSCGVFIIAAKGALVPQMVGKDRVFFANARLASINGAAQLFAPVLAGIIVVRIGSTWAFALNSLSYLFPAIGMYFVSQVETRQTPSRGNNGLGAAWSFVRHNRQLLTVLGLYGAYTLGMWSVNALFYPYCSDILGRGADVMGWSVSSYFGAFLVTGFILERWGRLFRNPRLLQAGFLVGACIWCGYTLTRSPLMAIILSGFDGIIYTFTVTRIDTWIQQDAPPELRGRVSALARAWEEIATISGQLGGGAIAAGIGILGGIRWSSCVTLVLVASIMLVQTIAYRRHTFLTEVQQYRANSD